MSVIDNAKITEVFFVVVVVVDDEPISHRDITKIIESESGTVHVKLNHMCLSHRIQRREVSVGC